MMITETTLTSNQQKGFGNGSARCENILEDENTPEDILDDPGKIFGGILSLAGGDGDRLGSTIWFGSVIDLYKAPQRYLHAKAAVTKTDAKPPIPL